MREEGGEGAGMKGGRMVGESMTNGQMQDNKRGNKKDEVEGKWRCRGGDGDGRRQMISAQRFITPLTKAYSVLCNSHVEKLIWLTFRAP